MAKFSLLFVFLLFILFYSNLFARDIKYTTKDPNFVKQHSVKHLIEGNNKTYPKTGDTVIFNFSAYNPHTFQLYLTQKYLTGEDDDGPTQVEVGSKDSQKCWDLAFIRMSKKEKIFIICKAKFQYNGEGIQGFIPPYEDIGWELELVSIKRKNKKQNKKEKVKVKNADQKENRTEL